VKRRTNRAVEQGYRRVHVVQQVEVDPDRVEGAQADLAVRPQGRRPPVHREGVTLAPVAALGHDERAIGRHRVLLGAVPEGELRRAESGARDAMARN
jgi:hypothetical protein